MKSLLFITLTLSVLCGLSGCSSLEQVIKPPKVEFQDINITNLSALNADLEITLSVNNPNNINFDVKNLKYSLDIDSKTVTTGTMSDKVLVKAKQTTNVKIPLRVNYKDILSSALMFFKNGGVPYLVKGSVQIGPFTIPFDDKGNLKTDDL